MGKQTELHSKLTFDFFGPPNMDAYKLHETFCEFKATLLKQLQVVSTPSSAAAAIFPGGRRIISEIQSEHLN